ncbi:MAG: 30S ribosomal protein S16 [Kiritimatiellae bacterium]|nr:30S ribosomal protein S16 [Kiritimatiellia bacterium]
MAVKIRLRRMGGNNQPFYRIVVTDMRRPNQGRYLENVGWYDPKLRKKINFMLETERIAHWEQNGAQVSDTVRSLMRRAKKYGKSEAEEAPAEVPAPKAEAAPEPATEKQEAPAAPEAEPEA